MEEWKEKDREKEGVRKRGIEDGNEKGRERDGKGQGG